MATFPMLSTGSVTQYPTTVTNGQGVEVVRFLDGSDQRFLSQGRTFRQWQIRLELLNDSEIAQIEAFFVAQSGDYSVFTFPDPISGTDVSNCRLAAPGLVTEYTGADISSTSFWVMETDG